MFLELRDRFRVLLCMVDGNTKREMRTVTRTASNFLFDVFFFFFLSFARYKMLYDQKRQISL